MGNALNVLDLFCGAGGFSEGFRQAGYKIIAGLDNDEQALTTYQFNFSEALAIKKDLSDNLEGLEKVFSHKIDVIIGGPPCQGFSVAGKRMKDDPRNTLYKAYLHLIKELKPRAVVVENVPTIMGLYGGEIGKQIVEDFEQLSYGMKVFKLLACDYGIPQTRKRIFFVGVRGKNSFQLPAGQFIKNPLSAKDAIDDLPLLENNPGAPELRYAAPAHNSYQRSMRNGSKVLFNHEAVIHKPRTIEIIKMVPDGGNYKSLPKELWSTRKVNIAWTRMNSKKPCFTIDAGHNHHFHYKANRVPTVRECARIQSFPDRFRFFGKRTSQYRQVGNAVPPQLARIIAESLKGVLLK